MLQLGEVHQTARQRDHTQQRQLPFREQTGDMNMNGVDPFDRLLAEVFRARAA